MAMSNSLFDQIQFFKSVRDAGYHNPGRALSELVDNSIDSGATKIRLELKPSQSHSPINEITVSDNGCGMSPTALVNALRFGGGSKSASRQTLGRFGMGLPNASLSISRRIEIFSWRSPCNVWMTYIDLDEILNGRQVAVPRARRVRWPAQLGRHFKSHGSLVRLTNVDRLDARYLQPLRKQLRRQMGQIFRHYLRSNVEIQIDSEPVTPFDPLFPQTTVGLRGKAVPYGDPLTFEIEHCHLKRGDACSNLVVVRFAELPVEAWHDLPNVEKSRIGISKGSGVSILRAGREIDYGWFFMGTKRRENYDDWWRCEVSFAPTLDEIFGVTNTKQGVRPTPMLVDILTPHIEAAAHNLNRRVRMRFAALSKSTATKSKCTRLAAERNKYIPPLRNEQARKGQKQSLPRRIPDCVKYEIAFGDIDDECFYEPIFYGNRVKMLVNENHAFGSLLRALRSGHEQPFAILPLDLVELLILTAARTEIEMPSKNIRRFRQQWGYVLNALLS